MCIWYVSFSTFKKTEADTNTTETLPTLDLIKTGVQHIQQKHILPEVVVATPSRSNSNKNNNSNSNNKSYKKATNLKSYRDKNIKNNKHSNNSNNKTFSKLTKLKTSATFKLSQLLASKLSEEKENEEKEEEVKIPSSSVVIDTLKNVPKSLSVNKNTVEESTQGGGDGGATAVVVVGVGKVPKIMDLTLTDDEDETSGMYYKYSSSSWILILDPFEYRDFHCFGLLFCIL